VSTVDNIDNNGSGSGMEKGPFNISLIAERANVPSTCRRPVKHAGDRAFP
jgi:hypothetical protein